MKTTPCRASHVNAGTSVPAEDLPWPTTKGRVMRLPKGHLELNERSIVTPYGGLTLVTEFLRKFSVADRINQAVSVFKKWLPYSEADHVLAQAMNLYVGGTCIEDMANLQQSEAVCRLVGAVRLPDPTTGGDFLRRFDRSAAPGRLEALRDVVDAIGRDVWHKTAPRRGRRRRKRELATVDLDGHVKELYGVQKEGVDFSHTGKWSYHPLVVSLAQTGECLALKNRPGNLRSSEGAAEEIHRVLPPLREHFENVLVRGDSDFDRKDLRDACEAHGAYFAFVGREYPHGGRADYAARLEESGWVPFRSGRDRERSARQTQRGFRSRSKKPNRRRARARERNYKEIRRAVEWVTEVPYQPQGCSVTYRLVIRRQLVEHRQGQQHLFDEYRYHYIVTNLPDTVSMHEVIDETYQRCDQEKTIAQLGSGLAAWRMPVAEFDGNCAWLEIARLAWNLAKWIAMLVLPEEVLRWQWKRFRQAFVLFAAEVIKRSRQVWIRICASHRFTDAVVDAHTRLQT